MSILDEPMNGLPGRHPGVLRLKTERAGFEPATHLSARTRFPVALLRPLGHLSERLQRSRSSGGYLDLDVHARSLVARDSAVELDRPRLQLHGQRPGALRLDQRRLRAARDR